MGRGSSGVAAAKGKSLSSDQAVAAAATSYNQLRVAIENGKDTKPAEKAYREKLKSFTLNALEKEQARRMDKYNEIGAMNPDKFDASEIAQVAWQVVEKMEFIARQELIKRDPAKYGGDWYIKKNAASRKKYLG